MTALEQEALPEAYEAAKAYGSRAIWTKYPAAVVDEDASSVDLGSPQNYDVVILPPDELSEQFDADGNLVERAGVRFDLMTGALTAEAIAFTPALGDFCTVNGVQRRVRSLNAELTGDYVAYYTVEARG